MCKSLFNLLLEYSNKLEVVCGECSLGPLPSELRQMNILKRWCRKLDHFCAYGVQLVLEIYNLDRAICVETSAEKFDENSKGTHPQCGLDRIFTPCGKLQAATNVISSYKNRAYILPQLH
jgi:hypothetical protein